MTERTDVARGRDIVVRWSALAEQRLDYLTELFETGRWRRYYSENDFLENIREAKGAVETWHGLLTAEATPDNRPIDFSWIGRSSAVLLPKVNVSAEPIQSIAPQLAELPVAPSVSVVPAMAEPQPEPEPVPQNRPQAPVPSRQPEPRGGWKTPGEVIRNAPFPINP